VGTRVRLVSAAIVGALVFVIAVVMLPSDGALYGMILGALTAGLAFVRLAPKRPVFDVRIVHDARRPRSTWVRPKAPPGWGRPRRRGR